MAGQIKRIERRNCEIKESIAFYSADMKQRG